MQTRHQSRKSSYTDSSSVPSSPLVRRTLLNESKLKTKHNENLKGSVKSQINDSHISDDNSEGTEDESSEFKHMSDISDYERPKLSPNSSLKKSPPKEQPKKTVVLQYENTYLLVFGIILLIIAIILGFLGVHKEKKSSPTVDPLDQSIDEMRNSFPNQPIETWVSILAALTNVMEEEPPQPAVLLLIGQSNTDKTMNCVAQQLAVTTNKLLSTLNSAAGSSKKVFVQVSDINRLERQEDTMKEELDTRIRSILNQSYSVVLGPLEDIPPRAALILHGFCDNFTAPFKKRVIILTATFDSNRPVNSKQVDRKLRGLWDPKLGPDQSASLISRIANNVVFIEPETIPCATEI